MADMRDVYGNPVRQTDEYGNPVRHTGGTMGSYDTGATGYGGDQVTGGRVGYGDTRTGTGTGFGGDVYGKPVRQTDEYGNPVRHTGGTMGSYDTGATGYGGDPVTGGRVGYGDTRTGTGTGLGGDVYGNSVRQTDEYGNPVRHTGGTMGSYDTGATGYGGDPVTGGRVGYGDTRTGFGGGSYDTGAGMGVGVDQPPIQNQYGGVTIPTSTNTQTQLHRSGSYSSSSSEDDGVGGRRKKKGLMEKIKEKLPGGHKQEEYCSGGYGATTTPVYDAHGRYAGTEQHEKRGIMDKIKDKLPGSHY